MRDIEQVRAEVRRRLATGEPQGTQQQFLAEVAGELAHWPARNPVMRAALDRVRQELLQLSQSEQLSNE